MDSDEKFTLGGSEFRGIVDFSNIALYMNKIYNTFTRISRAYEGLAGVPFL